MRLKYWAIVVLIAALVVRGWWVSWRARVRLQRWQRTVRTRWRAEKSLPQLHVVLWQFPTTAPADLVTRLEKLLNCTYCPMRLRVHLLVSSLHTQLTSDAMELIASSVKSRLLRAIIPRILDIRFVQLRAVGEQNIVAAYCRAVIRVLRDLPARTPVLLLPVDIEDVRPNWDRTVCRQLSEEAEPSALMAMTPRCTLAHAPQAIRFVAPRPPPVALVPMTTRRCATCGAKTPDPKSLALYEKCCQADARVVFPAVTWRLACGHAGAFLSAFRVLALVARHKQGSSALADHAFTVALQRAGTLLREWPPRLYLGTVDAGYLFTPTPGRSHQKADCLPAALTTYINTVS